MERKRYRFRYEGAAAQISSALTLTPSSPQWGNSRDQRMVRVNRMGIEGPRDANLQD